MANLAIKLHLPPTAHQVLSATALEEQSTKGGHAKGLSRLSVHHTRDTLCAGPHASGELRLGSNPNLKPQP